jgi:hypothetical protein
MEVYEGNYKTFVQRFGYDLHFMHLEYISIELDSTSRLITSEHPPTAVDAPY